MALCWYSALTYQERKEVSDPFLPGQAADSAIELCSGIALWPPQFLT